MAAMGHADTEITPFLKSRRAALDPAEVGLPDGFARRRVRGLRREEVAGLAGISVDYYTRIEQGRAAAVSDGVLDGIARALRLTPPEHAYLRNIAVPRRRADAPATCQAGAGTARPRPGVRPQILELLEALEDTVPAVIYGAGTDLLAWNRLGGRLGFDFDALPDSELNAARLMFLHPAARTFYPDWDDCAADIAATLRAAAGRDPDQPRLRQVICELRELSAEFRGYWDAQAVRATNHGIKRMHNPEVGELVLTYEGFLLPGDPDLLLATYTAARGSESARRLRLLAAGVGAGIG
jgi:transcriptional regulator with XRE-family HTH domain